MSDKIELNRRRVLGGLVTIGAAGAAVGAGTFAYFTDSEDSTDNTITAASLDLAIDGENDTETTTVEAGTGGTGIVPGDSGSGTSTLTNNGTIDGYLDVGISNVSSNPLADNLRITITLDDNPSGSGGETEVVDDDASNIENSDYDVNHPLNADEETNLVIAYDLPTGVEEGEGETVTFDVTVMLDQTDGEQ